MNFRSGAALLVLLFLCSASSAQLVVGATRDDFQPSIYLTDVNGKAIPAKNAVDVEGSPLLSEDWNTGKVKLRDNRRADSIQLKFNMETNKVYFLRENITYEFVDDVQEFSMNVWNSGVPGTVTFRNGYPVSGQQNNTTFFEVLAEGPRVQLLRHTEKKMTESYVYNGPAKLSYTTTTTLYVYDSITQRMNKIKLKRSSITDALAELEKNIGQLCDQHKWELKSIDEIKLLVKELK